MFFIAGSYVMHLLSQLLSSNLFEAQFSCHTSYPVSHSLKNGLLKIASPTWVPMGRQHYLWFYPKTPSCGMSSYIEGNFWCDSSINSWYDVCVVGNSTSTYVALLTNSCIVNISRGAFSNAFFPALIHLVISPMIYKSLS